jgi:hypothetical protein
MGTEAKAVVRLSAERIYDLIEALGKAVVVDAAGAYATTDKPSAFISDDGRAYVVSIDGSASVFDTAAEVAAFLRQARTEAAPLRAQPTRPLEPGSFLHRSGWTS